MSSWTVCDASKKVTFRLDENDNSEKKTFLQVHDDSVD